ncbi:hypothetical protein CF149_00520 [Pseudomonas psychrophila]|nr:hypothetical protein CF149_00520 [Pseudomonas psychrophila]
MVAVAVVATAALLAPQALLAPRVLPVPTKYLPGRKD